MIESPSDFRWQYLPRFPPEVLNKVTEYFWSNYPTEEDIASIPNEIPYIGNTTFANMFTEDQLILDHPLLKNAVLFFISKPNSGVSNVHTDKSRDFSINFPIQVDPVKGPFLCGLHKEYKRYIWKETVILDGQESNQFGYREKDFEKVLLDQPILLSTKVPHTWANYSDKHRVIASFFLKVSELDEAIAVTKDWM